MFLRGAAYTVLTLFGGLLIGLLVGNLMFKVLPGSSVMDPAPLHIALAAVPALGGFLVGGAAWGRLMGRMAGSTEERRMAWAGLIGFAPITITLAVSLAIAEPYLLATTHLAMHRLFTVLFVLSAFFIAGTSAWALGWGLRDKALAQMLFWRIGLVAAATFLAVNLLMEAAGWVVGAPGAAERATMITVTAVGNLLAAIVAGGIMGRMVASRVTRHPVIQ